MYGDRIINYLDDILCEETNHINTYNWNAPITNHLDVKVFKREVLNQIWAVVNIHNGWGDVRSGYTLQFAFKFENTYYNDFISILSDLQSAYKTYYIGDHTFSFNLFSEAGVYDYYHTLNKYNEDYEVYIGHSEKDIEEYIKTEIETEEQQ